jgi:phenylpyruvate tautomerase PptA (4-oxalocrotonate tautomerase family)
MPLALVKVSKELDSDGRKRLHKVCNDHLVRVLNKPEKYIMVIIEDKEDIFFAGTTEPAAYLEVKSIGTFTAEQTTELSNSFCSSLKEEGIPPERVYIEFKDVQRFMWGYNSTTF